MAEEKKDTPWVAQLKKYTKQDVVVEYNAGRETKVIKGKLVALNFMYLNCVLIVGKKKLLIKNVVSIERDRDYEGK